MKNYVLIICLLLSAANIYSQERNEQDKVPARFYLEQYQLVVYGKFTSLIDSEFHFPILINRDVEVTFVVERIFKPSQTDGFDAIQFILPSDMLVTPGGSVSRYTARRELYTSLRDRYLKILSELEALSRQRTSGELSDSEYESRTQALNLEIERIEPQMSMENMTIGSLSVIGGETFYDLGGSVNPNDAYLIFVNLTDDGQYRLDPTRDNSLIYWGEEMEFRLRQLESLGDL